MSRRGGRINVYAPRRHGRRWRIEIRDGVTGERMRPSFVSEEEAWQAYRKAQEKVASVQGRTVDESLELYAMHLHEKGNRQSSITTTMIRLHQFFRDGLKPLNRLTRRDIEGFYQQRRLELSADSHRNELAQVKTFLSWCVNERYIRRNPALEVAPIGKRQKGKAQLRDTEARLFLAGALRESLEGNDGSLACAVALLMGLRASEITRLQVRDVDCISRIITIEKAKTKAGNRRLEMPDVLLPHFKMRLKGRSRFEPVFPAKSRDGFHFKEWVNENTRRLCRSLELPLVTAHGLRGVHSSIAQQAGATGHLVAQQLGHENERTTQEHYTDKEVVETGKRATALRVLTGGLCGD